MPNNRPTMANDLPRYIDAMALLAGTTTDWHWFNAQAAKLDEQDAKLKAGQKIAKEERVTKKDVYEAMGITATTLDKYLTLRRIQRLRHERK